MSYDISIMCDVREGNRLTKQRCHSDSQAKIKVPNHNETSPRNAVYGINLKARNAGWVRFHRPGAGMLWICPVCKEVSSIAGLAEHIRKTDQVNVVG